MLSYYALLGVTEFGTKEATPFTTKYDMERVLGPTGAKEVLMKTVARNVDLDRYPNYKLVKFSSPEGRQKAVQEFLAQ